MKKILAILLVVTMLFTVMLATACNNNSGQVDDNTEETSSSYESSSSTRVRPSEFGTGGDGSEDEPTSDTNSGNDNPPTSSDKPNTPSYDTDYSYTTSIIPGGNTGDAAVDTFDMLVEIFSEDFTKPTLTAAYIGTLTGLESDYNNLTATQKAMVKNAAFVFEARKAYDMLACEQAELLINDLPTVDASNLDAFYSMVNEINNLYAGVKDTAYKSSAAYQAYQEKVNAADQATKNAFEALVNDAKATFEYTPNYKAKLDNILATYNNLTAAQKSAVTASYNELNALFTKYNDTGVINEFKEVYNKLPNASAVVKEDKTNIELANTMFNQMTATQLQLLGDVTVISANLKSLKEAILLICPEFVFIRSFESSKGNKIKTFTNSTLKFDLSASSATGSGSTNFVYDGKVLKESFNFNKGAILKMTGVPYGGKLVIYMTKYDSSKPSVTVAGGSYTETKDLVDGQPLEFNIPTGGDYTITLTDRSKVYGLVFS